MNDAPNIYLDYNSTTPVDHRVLDAMLPFLKENFANPSSTHNFGLQIAQEIKNARQQVADFINAEPTEITFTSGATEAINLAIKGIAENNTHNGKHIVTVTTEHKAVLDTCKELERRGFEVSYLDVLSTGLIDLEQLKELIRPDTCLVCVMYVNNETGIIQPLKDIATIAHDAGALVMTDATQAAGKLEIDVNDLGVDLLCFSGHKMYAPKGIGALYIRQQGLKIRLAPLLHGGGHEQGLRSGTLNVPGIIALAKACEIPRHEMKQDEQRISALRNTLEQELLKLPGTVVNGDVNNRIHNTTNICFHGQDANVMIGRMKNVAVSNGAACSSAVIEPSHVLVAMGLNKDDAFSSIRFSLGKYNTEKEIFSVVEIIKEKLI
jgi:cysteine desulfurase